MGKKYIIELEDENYHQYSDSEPSDYLWRVKGFNALVFDEVGISKLTPYTEPDLEQVRKDAYEEGFDAGRTLNTGKYGKGLNDAWEAARKIWEYDTTTLKAIFGEVTRMDCYMRFTASEAIEKIHQYEQPVTAEDVMRQYLDTFCKGRSCTNCLLCTPDFTCGRGKHFLHNCVSDEEVRRAYAAVLAKMKES